MSKQITVPNIIDAVNKANPKSAKAIAEIELVLKKHNWVIYTDLTRGIGRVMARSRSGQSIYLNLWLPMPNNK